MANAPAQTAAETSDTSTPQMQRDDKKLLRNGIHALNGLYGATAAGVGIAFLATSGGMLFPLALGALALATGIDTLYQTGREALPQKAQNAISRLFTGHDALPPRPRTMFGQGLRVASYGMTGTVGFISSFIGVFTLVLGGGLGSAAYLWGGAVLMAGSIPKTIAQAVTYVRQAVRENTGPIVQDAVPGIAPDLAPAPALKEGGAKKDFSAAVTPAAPAPEVAPAPVVQPAAPAA